MTISEMEEKIAHLEQEIEALKANLMEVTKLAMTEAQAKDIRHRVYGFYSEGYAFSLRAAAYLKRKLSEELGT